MKAGGGGYPFYFYKQEAQSLVEKIRSCHLKEVSVSRIGLRDEDWQNRWKKYFKPFAITRRLSLSRNGKRQLTEAQDKKQSFVYIDTTFAFGTGLHATTRMMAQLIAAYQGSRKVS